jgi:hypothetical protein
MAGANLRSDRQTAARGIAGEYDMSGPDTLLQESTVRGDCIVYLCRVRVLRRKSIVH